MKNLSDNRLDKTLIEYYSKRTQEYEKIYHRSNKIRIKEQQIIAEYIMKSFKESYVLELACGTGYWTKFLLKTASKIIATDKVREMLDIASSRYTLNPKINFLIADAYDPPESSPPFSGAMACFWFSHIPKKRIHTFLKTLHRRLTPNSFVLFVDNVYQKELGGKLIVKTSKKDTWKKRKLESGEEYEILKNYYTEKELSGIFSKYSNQLEVIYLSNFWMAGYVYS